MIEHKFLYKHIILFQNIEGVRKNPDTNSVTQPTSTASFDSSDQNELKSNEEDPDIHNVAQSTSTAGSDLTVTENMPSIAEPIALEAENSTLG